MQRHPVCKKFILSVVLGLGFLGVLSITPTWVPATSEHDDIVGGRFVEKAVIETAEGTASPTSNQGLPSGSVLAKESRLTAVSVRNEDEHHSLHEAFSEAQRKVRPLTMRQQQMPENEGALYMASNHRGAVRVRFLRDRARILPVRPTSAWQAEIGVGGQMGTPSDVSNKGTRLTYRYEAISEHFTNVIDGIEHSFTVFSPPVSNINSDGVLTLEVEVRGLKVHPLDNSEENTSDLQFVTLDGIPVLSYRNLKAWDANGQVLVANMHSSSSGLSIQVDTAGAAYPLHIDPIIASMETDWTSDSDGYGAEGDHLGTSVAIDNNLAVLGAPEDDDNGAASGSAYVFRRNVEGWALEEKITPEGIQEMALVGETVSVSGDTIVMGSRNHKVGNSIKGAVFIYRRSGENWECEAVLSAPLEEKGYAYGTGVSIDGDTLLVGGESVTSGDYAAGAAFVYVRDGTNWNLEQRLAPQDTYVGGQFGCSVSLDGDRALIGAEWADIVGYDSGAAYIFERNAGQWSQTSKLIAADRKSYDYFGESVSINGSIAVVGAPSQSSKRSDEGAVYIFEHIAGNWSQTARLSPSAEDGFIRYFGEDVAVMNGIIAVGSPNEGVSNSGRVYMYSRSADEWQRNSSISPVVPDIRDNYFGTSVAMSEDSLIVGTPGWAGDERYSGGANIFTIVDSDWMHQTLLRAGDSGSGDQFGTSVALDRDTAIIGSPLDNDNGPDAGCAYVFKRSVSGTWINETKIYPSDNSPDARFGMEVDLENNVAAIGAVNLWGDSAAYVFRRNEQWGEEAKLTPLDPVNGSLFGSSISIYGDQILIGAPKAKGLIRTTGAAYLYTYASGVWLQSKKFIASDGISDEQFGAAVEIEGDMAVIGAPWGNAGAVYILRAVDSVWTEAQKLTPINSSGKWSFGRALDLDGNRLLVSAPDWNYSTGRAHLYELVDDSFNERAILTSTGGNTGDYFGKSVQIMPGGVAIGRPGHDYAFGAVYFFSEFSSGWIQTRELLSEYGHVRDRFGTSLDYSEGQLVVGAAESNRTDPAGGTTLAQGAVYLFKIEVDNDLASPAWQIANGFDPDVPNDVATLDSDNDGILDIIEIYQGTSRYLADDSRRFVLLPRTQQSSLRIVVQRSSIQTAVSRTAKWSNNLTEWHLSGVSNGQCTIELSESILETDEDTEQVLIEALVAGGVANKVFVQFEFLPNED